MSPWLYRNSRALSVCLILWLSAAFSAAANSAETIRIGLLKYGTVSWEMDVLRRHKMDLRHGISVETQEFASHQALLTALQSGAVDLVVGDWIWAARQRLQGRPFSFYPYSTLSAPLVVHASSPVETFQQLRGLRIGVAGGSVNKSWILYQAYAKSQFGIDLMRDTEIKFGAPPLLNELMRRGELDAVVNFWHYSRYLMNDGMRVLVDMPAVLTALGIEGDVPLLGWLFRESWASENPDILERFLQTSFDARRLMQESDSEWDDISPLQHIASDSLRQQLRDGYRSGIPSSYGDRETQATRELFSVLVAQGGRQMGFSHAQLPEALFWKSLVLQ